MRVKYFYKVWEQFAHTFEKSSVSPNPYILIHDLHASIVCWNRCFLVCLRESATGKMTVLTVGSFHGFHEKIILTCIYQPDTCFSCETYFLDSLYNWYISLCATYMYIYIYIYICSIFIYIYIYIYIHIHMDFHMYKLGEVFPVAAGVRSKWRS